MHKTTKTLAALALTAGVALSAGCSSDASVASKNLSKDADNFKIDRQIVFYNGITGAYVAEVDGKCSVDATGQRLAVICKVGKDQFIKNYLGLSDNVTWFALQNGPAKVSVDHYKVIFKPSEVVPNFEVR